MQASSARRDGRTAAASTPPSPVDSPATSVRTNGDGIICISSPARNLFSGRKNARRTGQTYAAGGVWYAVLRGYGAYSMGMQVRLRMTWQTSSVRISSAVFSHWYSR